MSAISRDTPGNFDLPPPLDPARPVDQPKPVPPIVPEQPPLRPTPPVQDESIATSGAVPNVAGSWELSTQVESTSFTDLRLAYELRLQQHGDRVTGLATKVAENGTAIGSEARAPMTLSGTIAGQRLTLSFVERGAERATQGKFVLLLQEDGTMRGRFSSTAAQSSGLVEARRVSR